MRSARSAQIQSLGNHLAQVLSYLVLTGAAFYIVVYLVIAVYRLRYPFELEWIEGGFVDQVRMLVDGRGMYAEPSLEFVPFLYTPLYFYVSALASKIFGVGFFALRFVSFVASLAAVAAIFLIVRDETRNRLAAFLSAGLFLAAFRVTGAWLDIARVDSLFLTLYLFFLYFVRSSQWRFSVVLAGLLVALAFLTKQTAIVACSPLVVYLFIRDWRRGAVLVAIALVIVGGTTLILNRSSDGWYTYYTVNLLAQQQEWRPDLFVTFWTKDILAHLPVAIVFSIFFLLTLFRKRDWPALALWTLILAGALAASFLSRVKQGGYENVLLPAYAVLSIFFGLGLASLLRLTAQWRGDYRMLGEVALYLLCGLQLALLYYNPVDQVPTKADLVAGQQFIESLSSSNDEVYLAYHGFLSSLAGKKTYAQHSAVWDIMRGKNSTKGKTILRAKFVEATRQQTFDRIILDVEWSYFRDLDKYYVPAGEVFQDETSFFPVTGWPIRPTFLYVSRRTACSDGTLPADQCTLPAEQN